MPARRGGHQFIKIDRISGLGKKISFSLLVSLGKIVLRPIEDGFSFLGAYIKLYCTYIGNRTKANFYEAVRRRNEKIKKPPLAPPWQGGEFDTLSLANDKRNYTLPLGKGESEGVCLLFSVNSYLGILKQFSTYRLRKKILSKTRSAYFRNGFYIV